MVPRWSVGDQQSAQVYPRAVRDGPSVVGRLPRGRLPVGPRWSAHDGQRVPSHAQKMHPITTTIASQTFILREGFLLSPATAASAVKGSARRQCESATRLRTGRYLNYISIVANPLTSDAIAEVPPVILRAQDRCTDWGRQSSDSNTPALSLVMNSNRMCPLALARNDNRQSPGHRAEVEGVPYQRLLGYTSKSPYTTWTRAIPCSLAYSRAPDWNDVVAITMPL